VNAEEAGEIMKVAVVMSISELLAQQEQLRFAYVILRIAQGRTPAYTLFVPQSSSFGMTQGPGSIKIKA
jgi:hypothetical protein